MARQGACAKDHAGFGPMIQFAVVREDPAVELELVRRTGAARVLLVASGGCTALALRAQHPGLGLVLADPNPHQLQLVRAKFEALETLSGPELRRAFNVETPEPGGLSQRGRFEALFRALRDFLDAFVVRRAELEAFFRDGARGIDGPARWFADPLWPVAFDLHFSDRLLHALFTSAATQHTAPGSYPAYFQRAFETLLTSADAGRNRFLHHALLGLYLDLPGALPPYLERRPRLAGIELHEGPLETVPDLGQFDLVGLSNVLDWMDRGQSAALAQALAQGLRPGAWILWRQLGVGAQYGDDFSEHFVVPPGLGEELLRMERVGFYTSVVAARRR